MGDKGGAIDCRERLPDLERERFHAADRRRVLARDIERPHAVDLAHDTVPPPAGSTRSAAGRYGRAVPEPRQRQEEYSKLQGLMLDTASRQQKAAKIASIVEHFLGRENLGGLRLLDVGCSGGTIAASLADRGAEVLGVDIDRHALRHAAAHNQESAGFACAESEELPFADSTIDIVVCNHVYEHVVSADRLMSEIRRVLGPDGIAYLGLGNRLGIMEPHYRLPFLSWLPRQWAGGYLRLTGRGDHYHERLLTRRGLRRLCEGFSVWDYTFTVLAEPARFGATVEVSRHASVIPGFAWRAATELLPTYLWVATPARRTPAGAATRVPPSPVATTCRTIDVRGRGGSAATTHHLSHE